MSKKLRVSDVVTEEEIKSWNKGQAIYIEAGTGAGKSFMVKNYLYNVAKEKDKKILFFIHRTQCVNQFRQEVERDGKSDMITIMTYQKLEYMIMNKIEFDFSEYEYFVMDEMHYFLEDASFNKTTNISLDYILVEESKTRIFMSATGQVVHRYINKIKNKETKDYILPIEFNFIKELSFFHSDEFIEEAIESAIENKIKSIFFIQSATKAYKLHKKYKEHTLFNCGKSDKHHKYVDTDKINNMLEQERFEELILISTTCMDAGVNIIDEELTHVLADVKNTSTLIQCIGRKRPQHQDDKIVLCVKAISNRMLGGMITQLTKRVQKANYLRANTVEEYVEEYGRDVDHSNIVYDEVTGDSDKCTKKINEMMFFKCKLDISEMKIMIEKGEFGYCEFLAEMLGFEKYNTIGADKMKNDLETYLNSIVGMKLLKDEQKELINMIQIKDKYGRLQKSINLLNAYLIENKFTYMIVSKQTSKRIDGKVKSYRYWEVLKDVVVD